MSWSSLSTQFCLELGFGVFFTLYLLFIRWVPMIAIAEVKMVLPQADPHDEGQAHEEEEEEDPDLGEPAPAPGE